MRSIIDILRSIIIWGVFHIRSRIILLKMRSFFDRNQRGHPSLCSIFFAYFIRAIGWWTRSNRLHSIRFAEEAMTDFLFENVERGIGNASLVKEKRNESRKQEKRTLMYDCELTPGRPRRSLFGRWQERVFIKTPGVDVVLPLTTLLPREEEEKMRKENDSKNSETQEGPLRASTSLTWRPMGPVRAQSRNEGFIVDFLGEEKGSFPFSFFSCNEALFLCVCVCVCWPRLGNASAGTCVFPRPFRMWICSGGRLAGHLSVVFHRKWLVFTYVSTNNAYNDLS